MAHTMPDTSLTPAEDLHRSAFNAAFSQLGLKWHWDPGTYRSMASVAAEKDRIRTYLETRQQQLLDAFDPEFMVDAIHAAKMRCYSLMTAAGNAEAQARP